MRAASAIVCLSLGLIYFVFNFLLWTLADFSFSAGPASLSQGAAWMGLLAFAFGMWFFVATLRMMFSTAGCFWPWAQRFSAASSRSAGYKSASFSQMLDAKSFGDGVATMAVFAVLAPVSFRCAPGMLALVWCAAMCLLLFIERRVFKGRAIWHRLPRFFAIIPTFGVVLLSWVLFRSATLDQAQHYFIALFGHAALTETAVLLDARMFADFQVLLIFASIVVIFVLPPLHRFIEPATRWKQLIGGLVVAVAAAFLCIPAFRGRAQDWLYTRAGVVNPQVVIGQDGWLFDQRELRALTGSGLLQAEWSASGAPISRAKEAIIDFARQLKDRGIPLLLIPIPMKASIYPEAITRSDEDHSEAPLYHKDQPVLYEQLMRAGIDVQDITGALLQLKARHKPVFLKQDTHWTPDAMQDIARAVAVHVRKKFPGIVPTDPLIEDTKAPDGTSYGDLAERLTSTPERLFSEEHSVLVSFPNIANDPKSPIVLLGDDFLRIFDDPSLGFVEETDTHASFAQHLALYLGKRIDAETINDGGTTAVRQAFAKRLDDEVRAKKLVIWLVPARDLILPPSAGIAWDKVPFNALSSPPPLLEPMVSKGQ